MRNLISSEHNCVHTYTENKRATGFFSFSFLAKAVKIRKLEKRVNLLISKKLISA